MKNVERQEDDRTIPKDNVTVDTTAESSGQSEEGGFGPLTSEYTRRFC